MDRRQKWKTVRKIAYMGMRKWAVNPRMWAAVIFTVLFIWIPVSGLREFALSQGYSVSNWFFPLVFHSPMTGILLYFGLTLIFCNAPFVDNHQVFVLARSGKNCWFLGQIYYIFVTSILYFMMVAVWCVVEFVPYVGFSKNWELVLEYLSIYGKDVGGVMQIPASVLQEFHPVQAFLLAFVVNVACGVLLGQLILLVNLYKSRGFGAVAALCLLLVSLTFSYVQGYANPVLYVSPFTWTDIEVFSRPQGGIPGWYAAVFLTGVNILLFALILHRSRSYDIEAMEEL